MSDGTCPKCSGAMDDGVSSCSQGYFLYKSDRQGPKGATTPIGRARACLHCGYVEMYLDPAKLEKNLQGKTGGPRMW